MHLWEKMLYSINTIGVLRAVWKYYLKKRIKNFGNKMNYLDEDTPELEPQNSDTGTEENKQDRPRGFTAWIISGLAGTIATITSVFYYNLLDTHKQTKELYNQEVIEHKVDVRFWMRRTDSLQTVVNSMDNLDALQEKFEKARQLRITATQEYTKTDKDVEVELKSAEALKRATLQLKKATKK